MPDLFEPDLFETGLFETVRLGRLRLPNRLVMAPMTRSRADRRGCPRRRRPVTTRSGRARG